MRGLLDFAAAAGGDGVGLGARLGRASFRVYYLAGALLSAPLLGIGSLQLTGRRWAAPLGLVYTGLAIGVAVAMPVHGTFASTDVPRAQDHVDAVPAGARDRRQLARRARRRRRRGGDAAAPAARERTARRRGRGGSRSPRR